MNFNLDCIFKKRKRAMKYIYSPKFILIFGCFCLNKFVDSSDLQPPELPTDMKNTHQVQEYLNQLQIYYYLTSLRYVKLKKYNP